ncbi:family 16 glycoside hydrolase [Vallicoccus soli]|uniref:family 16 glycoside hydrolase n=1 Tax=Vallicoccus soli TaxID=2339232 RepID=UPI001C499F33|nr:family 16 glycoside hydrolase [Vallicoccus soli]
MALLAAAGLALTAPPAGAAHQGPVRSEPVRVGTWATAVTAGPGAPLSPDVFHDQTLRQVVRTSVGGGEVRVRFSNEHGDRPLRIGGAHVALSAGGDAARAGTGRALTFGGRGAVTVPAGAPVLSDPVDLRLPPGSDLVVDLYLPRRTPATTLHSSAFTTTYLADGDATGEGRFPTGATRTSWYFLSGVSVERARGASVVALGDSITDGSSTTPGANARWTDVLARRFQDERGLRHLGVLNAGIGGNRLLHDGNTLPDSDAAGIGPLFGESALRRLDRDVLAQPGVEHLVVLLGINDLGHPTSVAPPSEDVSARQVIGAYRQIVDRAHERGITVHGATLAPYRGTTIPGYWTPEGERERQAVNRWIRTSGVFDAVVDVDRVLRDPDRPQRMLARYDSGDGLHPNDEGMAALGSAVPLQPFRERGTSSYQRIFDGTLDGWEYAGDGGFDVLPGGVLRSRVGEDGGFGTLWYTRRQYADFSLRLQFRDDAPGGTRGNSGVQVRFPSLDGPVPGCPTTFNGSEQGNLSWIAVNCGHEIQVNDSPEAEGNDPRKTGSVYGFADIGLDRADPTPKGVWNDLEVRVVGQRYTVIRNGEVVNEFVNRPGLPFPDRPLDPGTSSRVLVGHVGLQAHGSDPDRVSFRNVRVRDLTGVR